jgi:NAD(P)-dependent dehydrogenase (short-subunit alcohol dehydrogenase family)
MNPETPGSSQRSSGERTADLPVAYVIGASGALGSATAQVFSDAGWSLGLASRSENDLRVLAQNLMSVASRRVEIAAMDASNSSQVEGVLDRWESTLGLPRACLHLAGGYAGGKNAEAWTEEEWLGMLRLNLLGPALVLSSVLGRMKKAARGGLLLAVGAPAGVDPASGKAPYGVSKAALLHLIRTLAEEGKAHSVRVNAIIPSILDTQQNRRSMPGADTSRWTPVDTAARVLLWLASDEGSTVTGSFIRV